MSEKFIKINTRLHSHLGHAYAQSLSFILQNIDGPNQWHRHEGNARIRNTVCENNFSCAAWHQWHQTTKRIFCAQSEYRACLRVLNLIGQLRLPERSQCTRPSRTSRSISCNNDINRINFHFTCHVLMSIHSVLRAQWRFRTEAIDSGNINTTSPLDAEKIDKYQHSF